MRGTIATTGRYEPHLTLQPLDSYHGSMADPRKRKKKRPRRELTATERDPVTGEDRRGEAVTVGWMLTMLATAVADVLAFAAWLVVPILSGQGDARLMVLPRLMLLIAATTGVVCILLTPVVYRFRYEPPPPPITLFGVVASVAPVLTLFWIAISN